MHTAILILASALFALAAHSGLHQDAAAPHPADKHWEQSLFDRVIENQKKNDAAMDLYERIERVESRKTSGETQTTEVKSSRVVPAGHRGCPSAGRAGWQSRGSECLPRGTRKT